MRLKGQEVNETESLLMNLTYYKLVLEIDYTRLSKESERYFLPDLGKLLKLCLFLHRLLIRWLVVLGLTAL